MKLADRLAQWKGKTCIVEATQAAQVNNEVMYLPAAVQLVEVYDEGVEVQFEGRQGTTILMFGGFRSIALVPEILPVKSKILV